MPTRIVTHVHHYSAFLLGAALLVTGCSSQDASRSQVEPSAGNAGDTLAPSAGAGGLGVGEGAGGAGILLNLPADSTNEGGAPDTGMAAEIFATLPDGFTPSQSLPSEEAPRGGYKFIGPLSGAMLAQSDACANVLRAVVRDFQGTHADFGKQKGSGMGFLLEALGDDRKPVLNPVRTTQNDIMALGDWYHNVDEVNLPFVVDFWLEPVNGTYIFSSGLFFPLDGAGYPETATGHDGNPHNFLFTTELHASFKYQGKEQFLFRGDDDVWVFINGHLVVDLGGIHSPQASSVDLDALASTLGIEIGSNYHLDLFHAERKPAGSNFRIETTLDFTGCAEILPVDVLK